MIPTRPPRWRDAPGATASPIARSSTKSCIGSTTRRFATTSLQLPDKSAQTHSLQLGQVCDIFAYPRVSHCNRLSLYVGPEADSIPINDESHVDEDADKNVSSAWRSWRQFRVRAILTCEAIMRRSLALYEREVFFFPQACRVCFQAKADGMIPCERCWNVAYCSEQHRWDQWRVPAFFIS